MGAIQREGGTSAELEEPDDVGQKEKGRLEPQVKATASANTPGHDQPWRLQEAVSGTEGHSGDETCVVVVALPVLSKTSPRSRQMPS